MTWSPPLLLRLLQALRHSILWICKAQLSGQGIHRILCRLALWGCVLLSKLRSSTKENHDPPPDELSAPKDSVDSANTYTIVRHNDTVSSRVSFSLLPLFWSDTIPTTSRNMYGRQFSPSTPELNNSISENSSSIPGNINGRSFSTSAPNLSTSRTSERSEQDLLPPQLSPTLDVERDLPSSAAPESPNEVILHDRCTSRNEQSNPLRPNQHCSCPPSTPPAIHTMPRLPTAESNSPENIGQPNPNVPASTHNIQPTVPDDTLRYARRTRTRKAFKNIKIEPLTTIFDKPAAPAGWIRLAHIEGARYYYNPERKAYTDSYISDPKILERMMDDITRLEHLKETFDKPFSRNAVLMIDVDEEGEGALRTTYYYADHDERTIFYLHPLEASDLPAAYEINGVRSFRHLAYHFQSQYWYFVSLYPDSCTLTSSMVAELRDIVLYLIADIRTAPYSLSPYSLEELFQILKETCEMEKNAQPSYPGCTGVFARYMYIFYHKWFLNFHGESFARIERNWSVFDDPLHKRTWLVKILSLFLFSAPDVHLRKLQKIWVDGILHAAFWHEFWSNLSTQWREFVVFATVLLTTDVGLIGIQSVDTDNDPFRSSVQILTYLSIVANIGALVSGLWLINQDLMKRDNLKRYLWEKNHPRIALEALAIIYSLPYAFLMWGILAFLAAFGCLVFQNTNIQTRSIVGSLAVITSALIMWCIITLWEEAESELEFGGKQPLDYEELQEPEHYNISA